LTLSRSARAASSASAVPATLAHHLLRGFGIVPERLVLDTRVQLVEPAKCAVPIEEPAQQSQRVVDAVDMGLRFGAH
jgi:hypothetical protein